jgi:hypothetical protein
MRPAFEVADIFRRHGEAYRRAHGAQMGRVERRMMAAIEACRTAALGGQVEACDDCAYRRIAYNACRNRHCPKCQGLARAEWLAERQAELLPVPYFHVVFTLPAPVAEIAFQNKGEVYPILFQAAETLKTIAADPRHPRPVRRGGLGAEIGFIAILHTWGQTLTHHPHVHCVVPGGGLSPDGRRWIACRPRFLLPIHVLSRLYRRRFLEPLQAAFDAGRLRFFGALAGLAEARAFTRQIKRLRQISRVVYAKPPFGSPEQVLAYLGRYTHRVAIVNSRLVAVDQTQVRFRWCDYRQHNKSKTMTLDAHEFIRRFLLHGLPDGFHRIRHYGFLANGHRAAKLALIRRRLDRPAPDPICRSGDDRARLRELIGIDLGHCPCCGATMRIVDILRRPRAPPARPCSGDRP